MSFLFAALVSTICVVASLRALRRTIDATAVNPARIAQSLRVGDTSHVATKASRLLAWARREPAAEIERELLESALLHVGQGKIALINAVLSEVDFRVQSQGRIPRVCGRVSSTVGLLSGANALRRGLVMGSLDVSPTDLIMHGPIADMLAAVLVGIAGATWCASIARAMRKVSSDTLAGHDALVDKLEQLEGIPGLASPGIEDGDTVQAGALSPPSEEKA
jgi:hypothetical protein